jgi:hypothetical protein
MSAKNQKFDFGITALAGARIGVFRYLLKKYGVEKKYRSKYRLSIFVSGISSFFGIFDRVVYFFKSKPSDLEDPVFIIGHWRSGTTFLHNLMCTDPNAGFATTYQSVFPNNIFAFQWFFKFFIKKLIPERRPVDNVILDVDFPQEDEFALNNEIPFSFYNWWYFPKKTRDIANEYLFGTTTNPKDIINWENNYRRFVIRSLINTEGKRFISKNPPHTARIEYLLDLYPHAKFIYIDRNPYEVIHSTFAFYKGVLPGIQLQDIDEGKIMQDILWVYKRLYEKYEKDKLKIPAGNLMEIKYVNLINDPKDIVKKIYKNLIKDDYSKISSNLDHFLGKQNHRLKEYNFKEDYLKNVNKDLANIIEKQGYSLKN